MSSSDSEINKTLLSGNKLEEELKLSKSLKASVISHFDNSMYSVMNNASLPQLFVFEFIAVFIFTFTFCNSMVPF